MLDVAQQYPEQYRQISKALGDLGRHAAWDGGYSIRAKDVRPVINVKKYFDQMDAELKVLKTSGVSGKEFEDTREEILIRYSDLIERQTMAQALSQKNSWAQAVASGARGNAAHVKAIISTPGLFADASGRTIPLFVRNSYSQGVRPAESLAGTYGSRSSVVATKRATARGGDFGKILGQTASNYTVTVDDCKTTNGIDLEADDPSLAGRVLARQAGDYGAGQVVDRRTVGGLSKLGKPVIVRSAMTCQAPHGLCRKCIGVGPEGKFLNVGDSVGMTAAQAMCLAEGTLVVMADLSRRPIQLVAVGEMVLGCDQDGRTYPVEVVNIHDNGKQLCDNLEFGPGVRVCCTPNHRFGMDGSILEAREIEGQALTEPDISFFRDRHLTAKYPAGYQQVYDLEVASESHLYVLDGLVVTHNSEPVIQGSLNCLAYGTEVLTADLEVVAIQKILPGDWVLGCDLNGKTFPTKVTAVWDQGIQPVQRHVFDFGGELKPVHCTADHPILQVTVANPHTPRKIRAGDSEPDRQAVIPGGFCEGHPDQWQTAPLCEIVDVGDVHCFDISVEHPEQLFCLVNGLVVKNTKHNSGAAKGKKEFAGLDTILQFVQVPEDFPNKAVLSEVQGMVEGIRPAPQGGTVIRVNGTDHMVAQGFEPTVKVGQKIDQGDELSEGLVSPADVVRLRGLGEGRRYYADRLEKILSDSGAKPDRRQTEIVARAAVDNYVVEDPEEDSPWLPDDRIRESELLQHYRPPQSTRQMKVGQTVGQYLQKPTLHYSIGTQLTGKMVERMTKAGVNEISVSPDKPSIKADMVRLRSASHDSRDWVQSMSTSYLKSQMTESLERGDTTNVLSNHHFAPRLAYGVGFGDKIGEEGKF